MAGIRSEVPFLVCAGTHKSSFMRCPCACRRRRLVQDGGLGLGSSGGLAFLAGRAHFLRIFELCPLHVAWDMPGKGFALVGPLAVEIITKRFAMTSATKGPHLDDHDTAAARVTLHQLPRAQRKISKIDFDVSCVSFLLMYSSFLALFAVSCRCSCLLAATA